MLNKVLAKQLEQSREKLSKLKESIDGTISEYQRKDSEYAASKVQNEKQSRYFIFVVNKQAFDLSNLDRAIQNLEMKVGVLLDELASLKVTNKEHTLELTKLKTEEKELRKANEKNYAELKKKFEQAKGDLRKERELELHYINSHKAAMDNVKKEFDRKLQEAQHFWSNKCDLAEQKYKDTKETLIERIHCLDSEIDATEAAILAKPQELEALKCKHEGLLKKMENMVAARFLYNESRLTLRSLEIALKYVEKQPKYVDEDLILGVLIAKANLQWIVATLKYHYRSKAWTHALELLLQECDNIIEFSTFDVPLLERHLWENSAGDLKFGLLKEADDDFVLPKLDSCQAIVDYMENGTPNDSDFCINELVHSSCDVSEICWLSELNGDSHSGYKTTHRLLYFQLADRMKCDKLYPKKFSAIETVKTKLCRQMLSEARALSEESDFSLTRDLFMEQIALCGLEGHEEFASEAWRKQVRSWQSREGCFGFIKNCSAVERDDSRKQIKKRSSSYIDGCHTHVTAVAIPTLAFFLRVTLKAVLSS